MVNPVSARNRPAFGFMDFVWRLLASLILVISTYNPGGYSFYHWLDNALAGAGLQAQHVFVGVILLTGWVIFGVATRRSLGSLGLVLGAALIGSGFWLLVQLGLIRADSANAMTWLGLIALAILLAIGLSWSHVWRRLSGQLEVDDSD